MMDEKEFIILVKFNSISIYSFINIGNNFVHLKGLYIYLILIYRNVSYQNNFNSHSNHYQII